jgi:hypothetical protein
MGRFVETNGFRLHILEHDGDAPPPTPQLVSFDSVGAEVTFWSTMGEHERAALGLDLVTVVDLRGR